jgi:hypothetical protein
MHATSFLEIAGMFLIPLLSVLIPILIGEQYGIYRSRKVPARKDLPVGSIVSAALGLVGFMLAFTFQIAASRFDSRKVALFEDVTVIRTAYLRAGLIPEPYRSDTKRLLAEYVDLRVALSDDNSRLIEIIASTQQILDTLWKYTEALAAQDRSSEVYSLYTTSINDLVDLYNKRLTIGLVYRIPEAILWVLFTITVFSMLAFGYHVGITGKKSFKLNVLLSTIFAIVMFLIFALDRPEIGLTPLIQKPMKTHQQELKAKQSGARSSFQPG